MQIENYCLIAGISVIFLIGCLVHLHENDIFSVEIIGKFKKLIYVLMGEIAVDCLFVLLEGQEVTRLMLYSLKGIELLMNPILVFLVFNIFYDEKSIKQDKMRGLNTIMVAVIALNGVLQLVEVIFQKGYLFFIDEHNTYQRGNFVGVYLLILAIMVLSLVRGIFIFSTRNQIIMKATLITFISILVIGILLRGILPNKNFDFLCMSVAMPFLLIYYSYIILRIDPTTHLLNRHVYARMIENINYTTVVIIIDANCFKQINDIYTHECGDRTLKQIAHSIYETYGKYAYCFRLGGDEFCAILKPGVFSELIDKVPHCDARLMADELMGRLDKAICDRAKSPAAKDSHLEYGVSQGYEIFYSEEDYPDIKNRPSFGRVIKLADRMMYKNKNLYKKAHPEIFDLQQKYISSKTKTQYGCSTFESSENNIPDKTET